MEKCDELNIRKMECLQERRRERNRRRERCKRKKEERQE